MHLVNLTRCKSDAYNNIFCIINLGCFGISRSLTEHKNGGHFLRITAIGEQTRVRFPEEGKFAGHHCDGFPTAIDDAP